MSVSADGRMRAALSVVGKRCRKSDVGVGSEDGQLSSFATYESRLSHKNLRFNLNYIMELCVNEIIINFVRENECLFNKTNVNFKNI